MNVSADDFGYYWCMVRVRNQGALLPNPSTILHLGNVCASAPVCNSSIQLYRDWPNYSCANQDNNNITLPEMLQCNQSTSRTPDDVTSIRSSRTAHPMDSSATLPLQIVTGKSGGDNIIRATGLEDKVKTIMLHVPSPSSTVVYTEPLPTVMVSDGDSDTQLNWLYVGIAMATVLTAVAVILILIICIQCKKRRVKGKYMKLSLLLMTHLHSHRLSLHYIITTLHIRQARHPLSCKFQPESIFIFILCRQFEAEM